MVIRGISTILDVKNVIYRKIIIIEGLITLNECHRNMWGKKTLSNDTHIQDMIRGLAECDEFEKKQLADKKTVPRNTWIHSIMVSAIYFTSAYFLWP
jgi:hypothetical protein